VHDLFGPIFPTALSLALPDLAANVSSSLGGMLLLWVQGLLLESRGPTANRC
jgi:hypothetical protein